LKLFLSIYLSTNPIFRIKLWVTKCVLQSAWKPTSLYDSSSKLEAVCYHQIRDTLRAHMSDLWTISYSQKDCWSAGYLKNTSLSWSATSYWSFYAIFTWVWTSVCFLTSPSLPPVLWVTRNLFRNFWALMSRFRFPACSIYHSSF
jgi:hypothetical protein